MAVTYQQLLKPENINTVSGLALISRVIVDGYLNGLNHSRRVGSGMEFSQYRAYEKGDDLRLLDWKMLARSGRHYIKQSEIETNISVKFILDASKSMLHQERSLSKFDYAKVIIAALSYLAQKQGDALGLFALNDGTLHSVYPKIQKQHFNRLLLKLIEIRAEGSWPENIDAYKDLHDRAHKELIIFVTDLYESNDELINAIKRLKTRRNEVIVLHLMEHDELEFSHQKSLTFEDLETGNRVKVEPQEIKSNYLQQLEAHIKAKKDFLLDNDISYQLFKLNQPIAETITQFLNKRKQLL